MSETTLPMQEEEQENQQPEDDSPESSSSVPTALPLCKTCNKRRAREGCTMRCCVTCCDDTACEVHMKSKEQKAWKESVLAGTTDIQKRAAELRRRRLVPGTFRESLFLYVGDSVVLWNLREYANNPKWREDAVRKSKRRAAGMLPVLQKRRRLAEIVDELYEKLLQK